MKYLIKSVEGVDKDGNKTVNTNFSDVIMTMLDVLIVLKKLSDKLKT